jgi:hypothetical protein
MEDKQFQEIPERFYSFESGKPFTHCLECDKYLLDGSDYIIEKAIRNYQGYKAEDTIFDYAMCLDCAYKMRSELSKESLAKMEQYFKENANPSRMMPPDHMDQELDMDQCLSRCIIKDSSIKEVEEYQIFAYCRGNKLNKAIPPYMVSHAVTEELMEQLSSATKDFLDGFYEKHFSPDPGLLQPIDGPRVLIF